MNNKVVYKSRQEAILIDELASSSMISKEQLLDIKQYYDENVAYHNFMHALVIAGKVLELSSEDYNIIEIRSLFLAALFHDAWHSWTAEDLDEFRSLDIAFENIEKFEKKYNYEGIDFPIVRKAIIWTVFKNRATNTGKYARLMADLDNHTIWLDFAEFLFYTDFWMAVEIWEQTNWSTDIKKWFKNISYFKFLMWINKNIFLNSWLKDELLSQTLRNIQDYVSVSKNDFTIWNGNKIEDIYKYWKDNDITFNEFQTKFF